MLKRIEDLNEYSLETVLEVFYCISVELKQASKVIQLVNETFPMESFRHLKRIRRIPEADHVKVLICPTSLHEKLTLEGELESLCILDGVVEEVEVPTRYPVTKEQYAKWNAIWPLVFHESTYERLKVEELNHFTRLFLAYKNYFESSKLSLLIVENQATEQERLDESMIIFQSKSTSNNCPAEDALYPFDHLVLKVINEKPYNQRIVRNNKIPYLLSGCIAIMTQEPCTMCAMSLLHSRIDAVIYFERNLTAGALGSICLLHTKASLNHHFPVYQVTSKE